MAEIDNHKGIPKPPKTGANIIAILQQPQKPHNANNPQSVPLQHQNQHLKLNIILKERVQVDPNPLKQELQNNNRIQIVNNRHHSTAILRIWSTW